MSYILDALRKSESERHQGKVPDLGRQLQLIHRPPKRHWPVQVLLAAGLLLNAGVLAYVFWPSQDDAVRRSISVPFRVSITDGDCAVGLRQQRCG